MIIGCWVWINLLCWGIGRCNIYKSNKKQCFQWNHWCIEASQCIREEDAAFPRSPIHCLSRSRQPTDPVLFATLKKKIRFKLKSLTSALYYPLLNQRTPFIKIGCCVVEWWVCSVICPNKKKVICSIVSPISPHTMSHRHACHCHRSSASPLL